MNFKYLSITILLVLLFQMAFSQEVKRKRKRSGDFSEEYYVLKEDKATRHGIYFKFIEDFLGNNFPIEIGYYDMGNKSDDWYYFHSDGSLKSTGKYNNDEKSGTWQVFFSQKKSDDILSIFNSSQNIEMSKNGEVNVDKSSSQLSSIGQFTRNEKVGVWEYYSRSGELIHRYDHSDNKLLFPQTFTETRYLNGNNEFVGYLIENLKYPKAARQKSITGRIYVSFTVNRLGIIEKINFLNNLGFGIEEQIQEVIQNTPNNWVAFEENNEFVIPITYKKRDQTMNQKLSIDLTGKTILVDEIVIVGAF